MQDDPLDCIIVGAGFAGLYAARILHKSGKRFKILEARDRVGGRVHTHHIDDDTYVDLGGQWIGPTQDKVYSLCEELNVKLFKTYNQGKNLLATSGRVRSYTGLIPRLNPLALLNIDFVIKRLERMATDIDLAAPWKTPKARTWDGTTLAGFLDRNVRFGNARQVLEAGLETVFAAPPSELSLLHTLFYIKSGGSLNALLNIEGGAQQYRLTGGAQQLAERLAGCFREVVELEHPVRQVTQSDTAVEVSGEGFRYQAGRVIVALPPVLAARLNYQPALSARRDQLTQRIPMGTAIKCYAVYERPWWRDKGLSGQVVADDRYWLQTVFDNSPPDASKGMLMGLCLANRARRLLQAGAQDRRRYILDTLIDFFGPEAAQPRFYIDKSWADEPWSRGCYTGLMAPGAWTSFTDSIRQACGRIHWAGTETATEWNGYIEGAIRSGERAAREVMSL